MSEKTKELEINGRKYMLIKYSFEKGWKFIPTISGLLGSVISQLENGVETELDVKTIGKMLSVIPKLLPPDEFYSLSKQLIEGNKIQDDNGHMRDIKFNVDFDGEEANALLLLKEILPFQFARFLPHITAFVGQKVVSKPTIQAI